MLVVLEFIILLIYIWLVGISYKQIDFKFTDLYNTDRNATAVAIEYKVQ
jgi:hypothetical protein